MNLAPQDLSAIRSTGRSPGEVLRMLRVLRSAPPVTLLDRACTIDDGVERLHHDRLSDLTARGATAGGRLSFFVPASGASTRLFAGVDNAADLHSHLGALFAGLDADPRHLPKVLLPFHIDGRGRHSALDGHSAEAREVVGPGGMVQLHITVSAAHQAQVLRAFEGIRLRTEGRVVLALSTQDDATDGVCVDDRKELVRTAQGLPRFRPGGHGALLGNLEALGGDLVLVRNVDNVAPRDVLAERVKWRHALVGRALELEEALAALQDVASARALLLEVFGVDLSAATDDDVWDRVGRPLRVVGVTPASGHVGGAPFWTQDAEGRVSPQLVDAPQVGLDADQQAAWSTATHVNPVDMVLSMRGPYGKAQALEPLRDTSTPLVVRKMVDGHKRTCFEHPGLWNGSMHGWNTVFVEVPAATFCPVKHVRDLVRPPHR